MQDFIQKTGLLLRDEYEAFEAALGAEPPVSIRINPRKAGDILSLPAAGVAGLENVPWCETGYYLPERPSFTFDPLLHAGVYYVQEASSMFLEQAMCQIFTDTEFAGKRLTALDLCAAPGGKSTHLLTLLPEDSFLVCNEVIRNRSLILAEIVAKWGHANTMITQNDPKTFGNIPSFFDVILADLPCSGEGMVRKDQTDSVDQVKLCAARQRRIIYDVWPALKSGGYLIYSTCTFNTEENEENVFALSQALGAEIVPIPVKPEWNIAGALCRDIPVYRFFPHRVRGEGFFMALLRKQDGEKIKNTDLPASFKNADLPAFNNNRQQKSASLVSLKNRQHLLLPASCKKTELIASIEDWVSHPDRFSFRQTMVAVQAIPVVHENTCSLLSKHLNILFAGISICEWSGKIFTPSTALALSAEINPNAFPTIELPYEQAISYLQREAMSLPEHCPRGFVLITYQNRPLGFVKNIGNRANNLYPQEWRIRNRKKMT